jgi:integrase
MAGLTQSPGESIFGSEAEPEGESSREGDVGSSPLCPKCRSARVWRDALRYTVFGDKIQRWLCRDCGLRFSDLNDVKKSWSSKEKEARSQIGNEIKTSDDYLVSRQICVTETKNLAAEHQNLEVLRRNEKSPPLDPTIAGKIVGYLLWLKKQGYAETTIVGRLKLIKQIAHTADLTDPETVKEMIAKQGSWSIGRKELAVECYSNYLIFAGGAWSPPIYRRVETLPFIPTEGEIDQLIASCGNKTSTFLQLLKETGARCGEAWQTEWTDIDTQSNTVRIKPEKHSNPRILRISRRLVERLLDLPNQSKYVFGGTSLKTRQRIYERSRKLASIKTRNPRLQKITFHTLRHWKATMEYHKTKDILHVMRLLGHKNIKNTLKYTQLVDFNEQDYVSKVAWTIEEACKLIEGGFQYVCDFENAKIFRKPK